MTADRLDPMELLGELPHRTGCTAIGVIGVYEKDCNCPKMALRAAIQELSSEKERWKYLATTAVELQKAGNRIDQILRDIENFDSTTPTEKGG